MEPRGTCRATRASGGSEGGSWGRVCIVCVPVERVDGMGRAGWSKETRGDRVCRAIGNSGRKSTHLGEKWADCGPFLPPSSSITPHHSQLPFLSPGAGGTVATGYLHQYPHTTRLYANWPVHGIVEARRAHVLGQDGAGDLLRTSERLEKIKRAQRNWIALDWRVWP